MLLLSDIHGNLPALEAVLKDVKNNNFEAILCMGDTIYGANPNECIEKMIALDAIMIAGNAETNIVRFASKLLPQEWYFCDQFYLMQKLAQIIDHTNLLKLYKLPEQLIIEDLLPVSIRMVHGSPDDQNETVRPYEKEERFYEILNNLEEDMLILGHTHNQWDLKTDTKWIINPGSVGMPLDKHTNAAYTIIKYYEDNVKSIEVMHYNVPYDINKAIKDFKNQDFDLSNPFIKRAIQLLQTGDKSKNTFLDFYIKLAEQKTSMIFKEIPWQEKNKYWKLANEKYQW